MLTLKKVCKVLLSSLKHVNVILKYEWNVISNVPGLRSRYSYSLRAGWFGVRLPVRARVFILHTRPDRLWSLPILQYKGYRGFFPGIKWSGYEVNRSSQCSDKVKNEWIYTSTPSVCLYGMFTGKPLSRLVNATRQEIQTVIVTCSTKVCLSNAFSIICVIWSAGLQHVTSHAILVHAVDVGLNSQQLRQSLCTCTEKYLYCTCTFDTEAGTRCQDSRSFATTSCS